MRLYVDLWGLMGISEAFWGFAAGLVDRCVHFPADVARVVQVVCEPSAHLRGNNIISALGARTESYTCVIPAKYEYIQMHIDILYTHIYIFSKFWVWVCTPVPHGFWHNTLICTSVCMYLHTRKPAGEGTFLEAGMPNTMGSWPRQYSRLPATMQSTTRTMTSTCSNETTSIQRSRSQLGRATRIEGVMSGITIWSKVSGTEWREARTKEPFPQTP